MRSNIRRLPEGNRVYKRMTGKYGLKLLMRPEQKKATTIEDSVQKFTRHANLVVNSCGGTFFVAKPCMTLSKHGSFIGYKLDPSCVNEAMLQLILLYTPQVSNKNFVIAGEVEDRTCVRSYV